MRNKIVKFAQKFSDKNYRILAFEAFLFSGLFAAAFESWIAFLCMLLFFLGMLSLSRGKLFAAMTLSVLWGWIFGSIGYSFGGWLWAALFGIWMFGAGVTRHTKRLDLSRVPAVSPFFERVPRSTYPPSRWQGLN